MESRPTLYHKRPFKLSRDQIQFITMMTKSDMVTRIYFLKNQKAQLKTNWLLNFRKITMFEMV